jgi:DNA-binding CsgD family transcriptional regulator
VSADDWIQWGRSATSAAFILWDFEGWAELSTRQVARARASGALSSLVLALNLHANIITLTGDLESATSLVAEQSAVKDVTGIRLASYGARLVAAYKGRTMGMSALDDELVERADGMVLEYDSLALAVLNNGLGRYAEALPAAREVTFSISFLAPFALPELIEAAVRTGETEVASDALSRLSEIVVAGSDWAGGIEARCGALLGVGEAAERLHLQSIACLSRTRLRLELARAHLLYGEWLRREGRRVDARHQLRTSYDMLAGMGAEAFAQRARGELLATGEKVRKRAPDTRYELTPQEEHIARLARDGRSNGEIGAELFISTRTVEWHLGKVFAKLGITSRRGLQDALPAAARYTAPTSHPVMSSDTS